MILKEREKALSLKLSYPRDTRPNFYENQPVFNCACLLWSGTALLRVWIPREVQVPGGIVIVIEVFGEEAARLSG